MSLYETLLYECRDHVATITLNRPEQLNSFNRTMRRELHAAVEAAIADSQARIVVLTGAGRAFCGGADLAEPVPEGFDVRVQLEAEYRPSLMAIMRAPKPFIAAVNGAAAGIGACYAMVCDLMIMGDKAFLYQAFTVIGLVPDGGTSWLLVEQI